MYGILLSTSYPSEVAFSVCSCDTYLHILERWTRIFRLSRRRASGRRCWWNVKFRDLDKNRNDTLLSKLPSQDTIVIGIFISVTKYSVLRSILYQVILPNKLTHPNKKIQQTRTTRRMIHARPKKRIKNNLMNVKVSPPSSCSTKCHAYSAASKPNPYIICSIS
jgi:hypothetical protein